MFLGGTPRNQWITSLATMPINTPARMLVTSTPAMVMTNISNCDLPKIMRSAKVRGEANRKPAYTNSAAREARGILSITWGNSTTNKSMQAPWKKLDQLVLAPLLTLVELRKISTIIGKPPTKPDKALPMPMARKSWFRSE